MNLCEIVGMEHVEVSKEDEVTRRVNLHLKDPDKEVRDVNYIAYNFHNEHSNRIKRNIIDTQ